MFVVRRRTGWILGLGLVALPFVVAVGIWLVLLGPFGYDAPRESLELGGGSHAVFAYGTLTHPGVRRVVIGRRVAVRPDVIRFHRREGLNLVASDEEHTEGLVFDVSGDELRRLDRYERLGIRYRRELRLLASGETAWVYFRKQGTEE